MFVTPIYAVSVTDTTTNIIVIVIIMYVGVVSVADSKYACRNIFCIFVCYFREGRYECATEWPRVIVSIVY